jgi:hypothetical protein
VARIVEHAQTHCPDFGERDIRYEDPLTRIVTETFLLLLLLQKSTAAYRANRKHQKEHINIHHINIQECRATRNRRLLTQTTRRRETCSGLHSFPCCSLIPVFRLLLLLLQFRTQPHLGCCLAAAVAAASTIFMHLCTNSATPKASRQHKILQ